MATVIVIRHGEAEGNTEHRFIGQSQVSLTDLGRRQARAVARRLAMGPVDRIVSSDLIRCLQTVTPLAEMVGVDIEADPRFREIQNGAWTGLLPEEIAQRWPDMWADYVAGNDVARPEGERWVDVAERVIPAMEELIGGEGTVVVASHGGPTLIAALWASGLLTQGNIFRNRLGSLDNASVTVIDGGPRLISYNDVGHLARHPDQTLPFLEE